MLVERKKQFTTESAEAFPTEEHLRDLCGESVFEKITARCACYKNTELRKAAIIASLHVLLLTIGSHGDVHPFLGLGLALKSRGHAVTFCTNDYFQPLAQRAGFDDFIALGSAEEYQQMARMPELWDHKNGVRLIFEHVGKGLSQVYDIAAAHHAAHPSDGVVVASSLCLGARVAQDKLDFRMATVHLAPAILRSLIDPAKLPGLSLPHWMPLWMKRSIWSVIDRMMIDPIVCPTLNAFRAQKDLPPVARPLKDWWHSPNRVLGLWPEWFGPMQPDWPPQTRLCGFPLYDEKELEPLPPSLLDFLGAGDKPIAFTPGSAMWRGEAFFAAAVAICQRLGRRGILLSRDSEHIPRPLPAGIIHVAFAPFSSLLPHVAALVHHGGIGTTSQALAAGVPQMVVAMSHDQPDNGARVEKLGIGKVTNPAALRKVEKTARLLAALIDQPKTQIRCAEIAKRFGDEDRFAVACNAIEELQRSGSSADSLRTATI